MPVPSTFRKLNTTDAFAYTRRVKAINAGALIQYLPMADFTGTVVRDESGLNRNGSYGGTLTLGSGGVGDGRTAVYYDGSNGANTGSTAGNAFAAALPTSASWACAFKIDPAVGWAEGVKREIMRILTDTNNYVIISKDTTTGQITQTFNAAATFKTNVVSGLTDTDWIYLCGTISKANDRMYLYVNGQYQGSVTTALGTHTGGASTFARWSGASVAWRGWLAHAALWSSELAASDAAIHARRNGFVVFEGDSRTADNVYPAAAMANATVAAKKYGYTNVAVAGQTLADMQSDAATQVDTLRRFALKTNTVVILGGLNDMIGGTVDANTAFTRLTTYTNARRAAGFRVVVCTELPASSAQAVTNNYLAARAAFNTLILNNSSLFDAVVRLDTDPNIGVDGASDNTTYYQADKIHPNNTGKAIMAGLVAAAL